MLGKKDGILNPSSLVKRNYREWKPFFPDHTTAGESHGRNPFLPATGVALQKKGIGKGSRVVFLVVTSWGVLSRWFTTTSGSFWKTRYGKFCLPQVRLENNISVLGHTVYFFPTNDSPHDMNQRSSVCEMYFLFPTSALLPIFGRKRTSVPIQLSETEAEKEKGGNGGGQ